MTNRGVIFDVDGVLVDSYQAHLDSWQIVGRENGFTLSVAQFIATFGRTTREIIGETIGLRDITVAEVQRLDARKEAAFREIVALDFPAMDGARELIDQLHQEGYRLAVGSSGPPQNVELALRGLDRESCFTAAVTGTDVQRGKPDPQVFLLAAERLRLPPDHCLVIEDAPAGIAAAHRAGMCCIGLVSRGHNWDELHEADCRVGSLREVTPAFIATLLEANS